MKQPQDFADDVVQIELAPGAFPLAHETMNAVGNLFGDLLQLGLPLNFYDTYVSRVSALTGRSSSSCTRKTWVAS